MVDERRIRGHIAWGHAADVKTQMEDLSRVSLRFCEWIKENVERTERNLFLFNLLTACVPYLDLLGRNPSGPIQLIALCTRGIYELNLRTRCILQSDAAMEAWRAELVTDNIEMLEGILQLNTGHGTSERKLIEAHVAQIREVARKHGVPEKTKLARSDDQAKSVGLEVEHKAFFKLFSKLVHPSSYLVNRPEQAGDNSIRNILLVNLQVYALDLLERLRQAFGAPGTLLEKPSGSQDDDPRGVQQW